MKKMIMIFMMSSILLTPMISSATTYYVSELFGDDNNDGLSEATPFVTIQKAADVMVAGDMVIVDFGEYHETIVPKNNGTAGNPIVYQAKEQGEADISTGEKTLIPTFALHSGNIWVMDGVFRTIESFSEDGAPLIKKVQIDSLMAGSIFHDRVEDKLYVWSSDGADPAAHADTIYFADWSFDIVEGSYITIDGFKIRNGIHAIVADNLVPLPELIIQNNTFEGDADPETEDIAIGIDGGAANATKTYENFKIVNNIFTDFWKAIHIKNAGRNSSVSQNTFLRIGVPPDENDDTIRLEGDDDYPDEAQCQGLIFERNYFEIYGRCFYFRGGRLDSVKIQNNIANAPGSLFIINYAATNCHIINNTIIGCGDNYALRFNQGADHGRIYNNILGYNEDWHLFFDNSDDTTNSARWDYNYWVTDTLDVLSGDRRDDELVRARNPNVGEGRGGPHAVYGHPMIAQKDTMVSAMTGDTLYVDEIPDMLQLALPLFFGALMLTDWDTYRLGGIDDFKLVEGSLAIDAGSPDWAPAVDFFGNPRDDKPDIGAIEFGATGVAKTLRDLFPKDYELSQNYPNPFNPETKIEFKLPKSGKVKLIVFNILGQKVATLVDGFKRTGTYSVTWNGLDLHGKAIPSGIYFYRLEAGSFTKTAKMTLLK